VPGSDRRQAEIRSAVSYAANELLENGMKFHAREQDIPITLRLELHPDRVRLHVSNGVSAEAGARYQSMVETILAGDAGEMFVARLEENARSGASPASGLGLLTMINDYGAQLGWKFEAVEGAPGLQLVTSQVELAV